MKGISNVVGMLNKPVVFIAGMTCASIVVALAIINPFVEQPLPVKPVPESDLTQPAQTVTPSVDNDAAISTAAVTAENTPDSPPKAVLGQERSPQVAALEAQLEELLANTDTPATNPDIDQLINEMDQLIAQTNTELGLPAQPELPPPDDQRSPEQLSADLERRLAQLETQL